VRCYRMVPCDSCEEPKKRMMASAPADLHKKGIGSLLSGCCQLKWRIQSNTICGVPEANGGDGQAAIRSQSLQALCMRSRTARGRKCVFCASVMWRPANNLTYVHNVARLAKTRLVTLCNVHLRDNAQRIRTAHDLYRTMGRSSLLRE